jgi:hypothetical protein
MHNVLVRVTRKRMTGGAQGMWYMHHYHWKCTTTIHQGEKKINVKSHSLSFLCPLDYIELSKNIQRTNANIIYLFNVLYEKLE